MLVTVPSTQKVNGRDSAVSKAAGFGCLFERELEPWMVTGQAWVSTLDLRCFLALEAEGQKEWSEHSSRASDSEADLGVGLGVGVTILTLQNQFLPTMGHQHRGRGRDLEIVLIRGVTSAGKHG